MGREELAASAARIGDLERSVSYLARDKSVHLELQRQEFQQATQEQQDAFQGVIDRLKENIAGLEEEREGLKEAHVSTMRGVEESHSSALLEAQNEAKKKLLYEYTKQDKLEASLKEMQQTLDTQVHVET